MDSRLLNVFHDDPFDGNYVKYENDTTDLWSADGTETLGLQLTETLNGILPIVPTDASDARANDIFGDGAIFKEDFPNLNENRKDDLVFSNSKNALIFAEEFNEEHLNRNSIEIIHTFSADSSDDGSVDDNVLDGRLSQLSGATFRTRTDSSSIGDYESHSSDYDEEDDDVQVNPEQLPVNTSSSSANNCLMNDDLSSAILAHDDFILSPPAGKNRTFSTNTICSDVDALGLDANNFDLADFITKDDFLFTAPKATIAKRPAIEPLASSSVIQVISSKNNDSDSDSDVIVDVETVELDAEEEAEWQKLKGAMNAGATDLHGGEQSHEEEDDDDELPFVDNVKKDPIWDPKPVKKLENTHKEAKNPTPATNTAEKTITSATQKTTKKTFSLIPSKRQSDLLRGKLNGNRNACKTSAKPNARSKKLPTVKSANEPNEKQHTPPATAMSSNQQNSFGRPCVKMGMGQGGKNLALIAHELQQTATSDLSSEDSVSPQKPNIATMPMAPLLVEQPEQMQRVKRKLNLEEYKQRRNGGPAIAATQLLSKIKEEGVRNNKIPKLERDPNNCLPAAAVSPSKHSPAVTAIVKTLKENNEKHSLDMKIKTGSPPSGAIDPITVAKNKVLRMQQLKKAQQLKIIDSTISAKVPRVTKVLPLKEIVRDTCYYEAADEESKKFSNTLKSHPDYEEIIIVSASCNTEVSIPPQEPENTGPLTKNANVTRSLLKSSTLLYNISNNLKTNEMREKVEIPTNCLMASIQDVVVKNSTPSAVKLETPKRIDTANGEVSVHGEDKIIMHLRKDRILPHTRTMSIQTDLHPDFPPLTFTKLLEGGDGATARKSRERERRKAHRRRCYRKRKTLASGTTAGSAVASSDDESSTDTDSYSSSSSPGRHSYRSHSRSATVGLADGYVSSSTDRLRLTGDAIANGGYSSRSSRRHRSSVSSSYSESTTTLQQRQRKNVKATMKHRSKCYSKRTSSTSSLSDYSDARSRSRTRSRSPFYRGSRSRSRSPSNVAGRRRNNHNNNNYNNKNANNYNVNNNNNVSQPAVEERRIVYVGRIEQDTTKEMLRRKFIRYGTIKQITIHFKDTGMKYGFVTYERSQDAFTVIDSGSRDPQINMYDISFGGRRAFCRASYADLDNAGINTYQSYVYPKAAPPPKEDDSFEALLLKVKAKMNANKTTTTTPPIKTEPTAEAPATTPIKMELKEENRM